MAEAITIIAEAAAAMTTAADLVRGHCDEKADASDGSQGRTASC